eukprot:1176277-Prorocentrum_minimum.AAC.1
MMLRRVAGGSNSHFHVRCLLPLLLSTRLVPHREQRMLLRPRALLGGVDEHPLHKYGDHDPHDREHGDHVPAAIRDALLVVVVVVGAPLVGLVEVVRVFLPQLVHRLAVRVVRVAVDAGGVRLAIAVEVVHRVDVEAEVKRQNADGAWHLQRQTCVTSHGLVG